MLVHLCFTYIEYNSALDVSVPGLLFSTVRLYILHHIPFRKQQYVIPPMFDDLLDYNVFVSLFFWCPCIAINNVSVQYNGGLLLDIVLMTQCYYHQGARLNPIKRFCVCSP